MEKPKSLISLHSISQSKMAPDRNRPLLLLQKPMVAHDDTAIVERIFAICAEFEFYGWRGVRAELRHRGLIVNHKKIRRLMREHDLQPRRRRRYVATTDSDHNQPIHPNRAKDMTINGPNQLWVAEIFASPFLLVDPALTPNAS
jgi:HTH-like domain